MSGNLFLLDETLQWLRLARADLASAELLLTSHTVRNSLFHSQQAIEKALKAFLVWHQQPFPKTHNLAVLREQCSRIDPELAARLDPAVILTRHAVAFRYPGEPELPNLEEAHSALAVARASVQAVLEKLPSEIGARLEQTEA